MLKFRTTNMSAKYRKRIGTRGSRSFLRLFRGDFDAFCTLFELCIIGTDEFQMSYLVDFLLFIEKLMTKCFSVSAFQLGDKHGFNASLIYITY